MNMVSKLKGCWWRIFIFAQEAYVVLLGLICSVLAAGSIDVDGWAVGCMLMGYLVAIVGLFISGIILVKLGKQKMGEVALAFVAGAIFILVVLILPVLVHAKRRAS